MENKLVPFLPINSVYKFMRGQKVASYLLTEMFMQLCVYSKHCTNEDGLFSPSTKVAFVICFIVAFESSSFERKTMKHYILGFY